MLMVVKIFLTMKFASQFFSDKKYGFCIHDNQALKRTAIMSNKDEIVEANQVHSQIFDVIADNLGIAFFFFILRLFEKRKKYYISHSTRSN